MQSEQVIQTKIIKYLESLGAYTVKTVILNRAGVPDVLACLNGSFIAVEVKKRGNSTSALQEHHLKRIERANGISIVAFDVADVKEALAKELI